MAGTTGSPEASAQLFAMGGETGEEWNSFSYGTAPEHVNRVTVQGREGVGGQVVDGAWVIAFRAKDLTPDDIRWQFLDASGNVVDSGTGIFPPAA